MTYKEENIFKYEDDPIYTPFDFFNKDLDLLLVLIFIEGFKKEKDIFYLTDFFKGDYWDVDDVKNEIFNTNDYLSIPDMVLEQLCFLFEDLRLGKVVLIGIDDTEEAVKDLLIEVAQIGPQNIKEQAHHFASVVEQLCSLNSTRKKEFEELFQKEPDECVKMLKNGDRKVFFAKEEYFRKLQEIIINLPQHVLIKVIYNKKMAKKIEDEIETYLAKFSNDEFLEHPPLYHGQRFYFSHQIESFYNYVNRLNLFGNTVSIPFSILKESDFEPIKILRHLQLKNVIKICWDDEHSWKVQFNQLPITPESLMGISSSNKGQKTPTSSKLKTVLSYDATLAILTIDEQKVKIKGPDQKEFLKIIFKNKDELAKEWFFSEISEIYDFADSANEKKFYNAAYQVNLKIAQNTAIKDFLVTTRQTARINPKYL